MPHDAYGHLLNIGDIVYIPAKVKEIHQTEEYCNVSLETERPLFPTSRPYVMVLNAGQVDKILNRQIPPAHSLSVDDAA